MYSDMELPKVKVTGVSVTALKLNEQVETMVKWAKQRLSKVVCVANVHMLIESRSNDALRTALGHADLVTPDGMPLVWMMRSLGIDSQNRVAGMDIFVDVCQRCLEEGVSIYLLGSTRPVLTEMKRRIEEDFPGLEVAGMESPPFRPLSEEEYAQSVDRINQSGAGVTFVSLGCPKQEKWMSIHAGKINSVMVGIGAVFPVYAGLQRRAPKWVRESGLEWLYRLYQEPRRLFGRYFDTIPLFIYLALKQVIAARRDNTVELLSVAESRSIMEPISAHRVLKSSSLKS